MRTLRIRNAVLRTSTNLALAALLYVPLAVLQADNPKKPAAPAKPAVSTKPAASTKPAGAAKPTTTGTKPPATGVKPFTSNAPAKQQVRPPVKPPIADRRAGNQDRVTHTQNGAEVHHDAGGHVAMVHTKSGMDIHHGPSGSRTVVRTRPDGARVVSNRYGHGYIGHPYRYRGVGYERRTYFYNGRVYGRFYRPYTYWGVPVNVYASGYYFAPAFYGWAYYPWAAPIAYPWGWAGNPWYGYYGAYFTPYPLYASPALWLTDYYVAQTLQAAYAERATELANAQLQAPAPIAPEVKDAIADEVRREIALEKIEAAAGARATRPRVQRDRSHTHGQYNPRICRVHAPGRAFSRGRHVRRHRRRCSATQPGHASQLCRGYHDCAGQQGPGLPPWSHGSGWDRRSSGHAEPHAGNHRSGLGRSAREARPERYSGRPCGRRRASGSDRLRGYRTTG